MEGLLSTRLFRVVLLVFFSSVFKQNTCIQINTYCSALSEIIWSYPVLSLQVRGGVSVFPSHNLMWQKQKLNEREVFQTGNEPHSIASNMRVDFLAYLEISSLIHIVLSENLLV